MLILIAFSSKQSGYDPMIAGISKHLSQLGHSVLTQDVDSSIFETRVFSDTFDAVILIDSLTWFLASRIRLRGRPWVCFMSTCFESLLPLMTMSPADMGIDFFISNCRTFFDQISQVSISHFSHKPVVPRPYPLLADRFIGAVLPNIADRDFCLLARTYERLKKKQMAHIFRLAVPVSDRSRLPLVFDDRTILRYEDSFDAVAKLVCGLHTMILCPRITDYRAGVVPPEILKAAAWGIQPICVSHPALAPIYGVIHAMPASLTTFDAMLDAAIEGKLPPVFETVSEEFAPPVEKFIERILQVYERFKNAAT